MINKLWQQIKSLFTEKTTTVYMLKRVDKYYGLQGCSYYKRVVQLEGGYHAKEFKPSCGWFIVTKERFDSVEGL